MGDLRIRWDFPQLAFASQPTKVMACKAQAAANDFDKGGKQHV